MKKLLTALSIVLLSTSLAGAKTVQFEASDGVTVTADFKEPDGSYKSVVVLFHMAGASRGEYTNISKRLNTLGYATLAVDQRSGGSFNGVRNETVRSAGGSTDYVGAIPDLVAASHWARKNASASHVGVLGSSYSAGLVLVLSAQDRKFADAVMSFSPGEYYGSKNYVAKKVGDIKAPTFLTSARGEARQWQKFAGRIGSPVVGFIPKGSGRHGASSLDGNGAAEYWVALEGFLGRYLPAK
ncbi:MAG: dienelactone hydrolase family protein [Litoreibacter sp.]|uniref:CocE/NonD family hydrolase n=1 Tax=Litoreibacter sp. TaxID=1969459 RepID=UPI0032979AAD